MEKENDKKIRLIYFDIYGRAEMLRMLLTIARVPFEDVRLTNEEWPAWKEKNQPPFGQLPLLEMDGKRYAQSQCILRVLCKKFGFYDTVPELIWTMEFIYDMIDDAFFQYWTGARDSPTYEEDYMKNVLPVTMKRLNKMLLENYPHVFFLGTNYTMADFIVLAFLDVFTYHHSRKQWNQKAIEAAPQLDIYWKVRSQDMKEYLARRKQSDF